MAASGDELVARCGNGEVNKRSPLSKFKTLTKFHHQSSVGGNPTPVGDAPTSVGRYPAPVGSHPTLGGKIPTSVGTRPTPVGERPSSVGAHPTLVGDCPTPEF